MTAPRFAIAGVLLCSFSCTIEVGGIPGPDASAEGPDAELVGPDAGEPPDSGPPDASPAPDAGPRDASAPGPDAASPDVGSPYWSQLVRVDMDTAAVTPVGRISDGIVGSLGFNDGDGTLTGLLVYQSGSWDSPDKSYVVSIDPSTAAMTTLFRTPYHTLMGLAKRPGLASFYTWINWTSHAYGEIDLGAQTVTTLGPSDSVGVSSGAMTFDATGLLGITWGGSTLVRFDAVAGTRGPTVAQLTASESFVGLSHHPARSRLFALSQVAKNLHSVNPANGAVSLVGKLTTTASDVGGLAYDPTTDTLYAAVLYAQ